MWVDVKMETNTERRKKRTLSREFRSQVEQGTSAVTSKNPGAADVLHWWLVRKMYLGLTTKAPKGAGDADPTLTGKSSSSTNCRDAGGAEWDGNRADFGGLCGGRGEVQAAVRSEK
jgi:hypothetical protein